MRPTRYHCTIFMPKPHGKKTSVYKCNIHFCQEKIEWSGNGVEQKSGISHLFNLSNFEFLGFQILMIWGLWGINFHTVVVVALIFHLWFKLLSALCDSVLKRDKTNNMLQQLCVRFARPFLTGYMYYLYA